MKKNIYEKITHQILSNLEQAGNWQKLWETPQPVSLNNHHYSGINHLLLSSDEYESPVWGTFNQVRKNGGKVNKGQSARIVVFWKKMNRQVTDPTSGEISQQTGFMLRNYFVFNSQQCTFDDIGKQKVSDLAKTSNQYKKERYTDAEEIISLMPDAPKINFGNYDTPCYVPVYDEVRMPKLEYFFSIQAYYSALFHELVHSTGHKKRLDRFETDQFTNQSSYSKEELVAELGASYLMSIANMQPDISNAQAYIKSWLSVLKSNPTWIMWAASRAQKACDMIVPSKENIEV